MLRCCLALGLVRHDQQVGTDASAHVTAGGLAAVRNSRDAGHAAKEGPGPGAPANQTAAWEVDWGSNPFGEDPFKSLGDQEDPFKSPGLQFGDGTSKALEDWDPFGQGAGTETGADFSPFSEGAGSKVDAEAAAAQHEATTAQQLLTLEAELQQPLPDFGVVQDALQRLAQSPAAAKALLVPYVARLLPAACRGLAAADFAGLPPFLRLDPERLAETTLERAAHGQLKSLGPWTRPAGPSGERHRGSRRDTDARNVLTHYDPGMFHEAEPDLFGLVQTEFDLYRLARFGPSAGEIVELRKEPPFPLTAFSPSLALWRAFASRAATALADPADRPAFARTAQLTLDQSTMTDSFEAEQVAVTLHGTIPRGFVASLAHGPDGMRTVTVKTLALALEYRSGVPSDETLRVGDELEALEFERLPADGAILDGGGCRVKVWRIVSTTSGQVNFGKHDQAAGLVQGDFSFRWNWDPTQKSFTIAIDGCFPAEAWELPVVALAGHEPPSPSSSSRDRGSASPKFVVEAGEVLSRLLLCGSGSSELAGAPAACKARVELLRQAERLVIEQVEIQNLLTQHVMDLFHVINMDRLAPPEEVRQCFASLYGGTPNGYSTRNLVLALNHRLQAVGVHFGEESAVWEDLQEDESMRCTLTRTRV